MASKGANTGETFDTRDYVAAEGPHLDAPAEEPPPPARRSLQDDVSALYDDGKTYLDAEFAYQKTRLSFAADRGKNAAIFGVAALGLAHLGLIALAVGLVLALATLIGPLAATLVVAVVLLGLAAWLGLKAKNAATEAARPFGSNSDGGTA